MVEDVGDVDGVGWSGFLSKVDLVRSGFRMGRVRVRKMFGSWVENWW